MRSALLTIRNLSVSYDSAAGNRRALEDVCLDVRDGDWIMIRGRNGSGKSTLLNAIMGLAPREAGTITFRANGTDKWNAFMVSQEPGAALPCGLTLGECLRLARNTPSVTANTDCDKLLKAMQLESQLKKSVDQLSGGQRQMAAILMAALADVPVILLDEPTASLDPHNEAECLSCLEMLDLRDRAIIHVTHNADHFRRYGTRRCEMVAGHISEFDSATVIP